MLVFASDICFLVLNGIGVEVWITGGSVLGELVFTII